MFIPLTYCISEIYPKEMFAYMTGDTIKNIHCNIAGNYNI